MSELARFSSYIGLVVLVGAVVLVAPRATVAGSVGVLRWLHGRVRAVRTWRPGTQVARDTVLPVEVRVGRPTGAAGGEVLEEHRWPGPRQAVQELWDLTREVLEAGAVLLAVAGVTLRATAAVVSSLPGLVVLGADLLLVLGTFLVMQRVIRYYPADGLPSWRSALQGRVRTSAHVTPPARVRHTLSMLLLVPGFVLLVGWPLEIGRFVAHAQFTGPRSTVLVVWATELPWLVGLAWLLARPLLPRRPARHARPSAPVLLLRRRPVEETAQRAA